MPTRACSPPQRCCARTGIPLAYMTNASASMVGTQPAKPRRLFSASTMERIAHLIFRAPPVSCSGPVIPSLPVHWTFWSLGWRHSGTTCGAGQPAAWEMRRFDRGGCTANAGLAERMQLAGRGWHQAHCTIIGLGKTGLDGSSHRLSRRRI